MEKQAAALQALAEEARQRNELVEKQTAVLQTQADACKAQADALRHLQLKFESFSAAAASSPPATHAPPIRLRANEVHNTPAETRALTTTAPQPCFELAEFDFRIVDLWIAQATAFVAHTDPALVLGTLLKAFPEEESRTYFQDLVRDHTLPTGPDWPAIWDSLRGFNAARRPAHHDDVRRTIATMKLPASYDDKTYRVSVMQLQNAARNGVPYHILQSYLFERLPPELASSPARARLRDDTQEAFLSWYQDFLYFGSCTHCGRFGHATSRCMSRNRRNPQIKNKPGPKAASSEFSAQPHKTRRSGYRSSVYNS